MFNNRLKEKNEKISKTMIERSNKLFVFEHIEKGVQYTFDGFNAFAKMIEVDPGNLHKTYNTKRKCKGWRLINIISLIKPDWEKIYEQVNTSKTIGRIKKKLNNIKQGLLSVVSYGKKNGPKNSYIDYNKANEYINLKKLEQPSYFTYKESIPEYSEFTDPRLNLC